MGENLIVCDLGNTSVKIGVIKASVLAARWSLPVQQGATADSLGIQLLALFAHAGMRHERWQACVACSVVPSFNAILQEATRDYLHCPCFFVPEDIPVPLTNEYVRPWETGADRLVGAWAAARHFAGDSSVIVVDYGTAVTFDCVAGQRYLGGLIFPGPVASAEGLARRAAKLPHVALDAPPQDFTVGQDTATGIRLGLLYGYAALTEGLCTRLRNMLPGASPVIGTGRFARIVARMTPVFNEILPDLVLEGLGALYASHLLAIKAQLAK